MPALLRLAFARLQPRRAAAMLPVRRVCRQPLRLAREPFQHGREPLPTRCPGAPLSPQRLCGRLLLWRVDGPRRPLAGALPQRGVVRPRLRAPNDWPLPRRVVFLLLLLLRAGALLLLPAALLPRRCVAPFLLPALDGSRLPRVAFALLVPARVCAPRLQPCAGPLPLLPVFARLLPGLEVVLLLPRV